jgi:two-component system, NtrC family, sensor histidine kinase PilS
VRAASDSRFFRPAEPLEGDATFARLYRAFLAARALVALAVMGALVVGAVVTGSPPGWGLAVCLVYAAAASLHATLPRWQRGANPQSLAAMNGWRWWGSIGLDLIVIALLQVLEPGSAIPFAALFILPVLMSGVLAPRLASLGAAALATLGMLASVVVSDVLGADWSGRLTAAGLSGVGYFLVAWLAAELADRLVGEQRAARGSMAFARQQSMLNQLVIDELREGVLVVDRSGQVRAANPAARTLLGEVGGGVFGLRGVAAWSDLADAVDASWERSPQGNERADAVLRFDPGPPRHLRMRMRFIRSREADITEDLCLLLLEDRATLVARARQEKLAGMGRMSASIAHEIRNPLSAISQANALLGEDMAADPGAARLVAMVESNVKRLQRIVDEVALLSAPVMGDPPPIDAAPFAAEVCADWVRTQADLITPSLRQSLPDGLGAVLFDPDHLRRVLINLLDNAWRHAQQAGVAAPWVLVQLEATDAQHQRLLVANPGPLLGPEVERHLFEPFYSTRSRGSGLGLTICRELCERYGARIDYQPQTVDGQAVVGFAITLRRAPRAESAP